MKLVRYSEYRQYEKRRIEVNDSMMALLAGSRLAYSLLKLTEGSSHTLSQIFPAVDHIKRFNLRPDTAQLVLKESESHLGAMAVPYALALHEDYVKHALGILVEVGSVSNSKYNNAAMSTMHETFQSATSIDLHKSCLEVFHLIRLMRNSHIHSGGLASKALVDAAGSVSVDAHALWLRIRKQALPGWSVGDPVRFEHGELSICLMVTKVLAEEINEGLATAYPRSSWADRMMLDLTSQAPLTGNPNQQLRRIKGFCKTYYAPVGLTDSEIADAVARLQQQ